MGVGLLGRGAGWQSHEVRISETPHVVSYNDLHYNDLRKPPAKEIESDFNRAYQWAARSPEMKKRLLWILLVALAALALLRVVRPRSHTEAFERLMASGRGYLEKGD